MIFGVIQQIEQSFWAFKCVMFASDQVSDQAPRSFNFTSTRTFELTFESFELIYDLLRALSFLRTHEGRKVSEWITSEAYKRQPSGSYLHVLCMGLHTKPCYDSQTWRNDTRVFVPLPTPGWGWSNNCVSLPSIPASVMALLQKGTWPLLSGPHTGCKTRRMQRMGYTIRSREGWQFFQIRDNYSQGGKQPKNLAFATQQKLLFSKVSCLLSKWNTCPSPLKDAI